MKMKLVAVVLAVTALALVGCGSNKPKPTLDAKVSVDGHAVHLQTTTTNFVMGGVDGHVHLYLDQISMPVTLMRPTYNLDNLPSGHHQFKLELSDPNHNPIGIEKVVPFDIP